MMQWRPLRVATASLQKKRARPAAPIVLMSITPPQDSGAREGNPSILDAQREFHGARQRGRERIAADRSPIALARDVLAVHARDQLVIDRKSTRLTPVTNAHLVCRLLLEKKKHKKTNT